MFKESEEDTKKEETITFTPGPGVEATVHGQNDEGTAETGSSESAQDNDELELIAKWKAFKAEHPDGALNDFYGTLVNTNQEG